MDVVYDVPFGATTIRQVRSVDYNAALQAIIDRFSGAVAPSLIGISHGEPKVTIRTGALGVLSAISASAGLAVTSPGTIILPWQVRAPGSTFVSNGSHYSLSATLGLIVPTSLAASQDDQQGASLTLEFTPASSDGATDPIAINSSVTLDAQAFAATHVLGPAKIDSTAISGIKSTNVNFGITVSVDRYAGLPWAGIGGIFITQVEPSIEIEFQDRASAVAFGRYGAPTTMTAFFRKVADGSTRVANGTSEHIAAVLTGGLYTLESSSGQGNANASNKYMIRGKSLAVSTAAAIS